METLKNALFTLLGEYDTSVVLDIPWILSCLVFIVILVSFFKLIKTLIKGD